MQIKNFIPPIIKEIHKKNFSRYGWFGNYKNWQKAKNKTKGYEDKIILEKCKNSLEKVKKGLAISERDSVLLKTVEYSPILLAGLLLAKKENSLNIIDFGGSLGSSYFQNKKILNKIKNMKWNVVEQENFVECGKKYFQDNRLGFYYTIKEATQKQKPSAILLSSVLQYLENPYQKLKEILSYNFDFIVIDRTPFIEKKDRITIQKVNPKIYPASYPCWFFNEDKFKNFFKQNKYEIIMEDESLDKCYQVKSKFKGFIFKKK